MQLLKLCYPCLSINAILPLIYLRSYSYSYLKEHLSMSALTVQVLRLSLSLGSVTAVNLRRFVCGAQGSLDR